MWVRVHRRAVTRAAVLVVAAALAAGAVSGVATGGPRSVEHGQVGQQLLAPDLPDTASSAESAPARGPIDATGGTPSDATGGPQIDATGGPQIEVAGAADSDWLSEINTYRRGSGLGTVRATPSWRQGLRDHLNYLAKTPSKYRTGKYRSSHTENPASPHATTAGTRHAASNLIEGAVSSPVKAINIWLAAPFHAIGLLRPQLTRVSYADSGYGAIIDELSGLDQSKRLPRKPILFPGPGMTTNLTSYWGVEDPDPLPTCGWTGRGDTVGLPLIALLPSAPSKHLTARVTGANGTVATTSNKSLCVISQHTYRSPDPVYGPAGAEILRGDHAVILIAKRSYSTGYYTATIAQPGRADITWTFRVASSGPRLGCAGFPDVSASNKFCSHIRWFARQGITKPADGLFREGNSVNRGSMAAFLFRMANPGKRQPACTGKPFPDVSTGHRFCGYIQWAKRHHIAKGYPDGKYRPENAVTRGAMAAYLHRIADVGRTMKCRSKPFADVPVGSTFCGVITWMANAGITSGVGDGTRYGTKQRVTRGQMAAFLKRM